MVVIRTFFITNALKLVENQAKAMQHSEAEFWIFENFSLSLSRLLSKNDTVFFERFPKK